MPTLCVIDMQKGFSSASCKRTRRNVVSEIRKAKRNDWSIVVVEYGPTSCYDETYPEITRALSDYPKTIKINKRQNDGSYKIIQACKKLNFCTKKFLICGVNSDYCVADTAKGLAQKLPFSPVQVIKNACNSSISQWPDGFGWIKSHRNIHKV